MHTKSFSEHHTPQFCPTNEAFEEFAVDLGLTGANLDKQLLAAAASNPDVFKMVSCSGSVSVWNRSPFIIHLASARSPF